MVDQLEKIRINKRKLVVQEVRKSAHRVESVEKTALKMDES